MLRSWRQAVSVLDSLGDDLDAHLVREMDGRAHDGPVLLLVEAADQGAVQLELLEGSRLSWRKEKWPVPKSSMEMVAPSSLSSPRSLCGDLGSASRPSSVTSNCEGTRRGGRMAASASVTSCGRFQSGRDGAEREVEGELQPQAGAPPVAGRAGRELDHLLGQGALMAAVG